MIRRRLKRGCLLFNFTVNEAAKNEIEEYGAHIESKPKLGYELKIIGEEHALRACIAQYWVHGSRKSDEIVRFHHAMFQKLLDCTKAVLAKWNFQINELQLQNLAVYLFISVIRVENGNCISAEPPLYEELANLEEYEIAQELRSRIQEALGLKIPQQEAYCITIHLATKKNMAGGLYGGKAYELRIYL